MVRLSMVGERQVEANLVYGGSFERSFKSSGQRKHYLIRLLMKQFIAVKELISGFTFAHPELSVKETSSGSARRRTSGMNEIVMHKQQHSAVPKTTSLTTIEEELARRINDLKKMELRLQHREMALLETELARHYESNKL